VSGGNVLTFRREVRMWDITTAHWFFRISYLSL
jgi:hypothetical protein